MKRHLESLLCQAIQSMIVVDTIHLERPKDLSHGDYALPCFIFAKELKQSPTHIAQKLSQVLNDNPEFLKVARPNPINGFLNLKLNDAFIWDRFINALDNLSFEKMNDPICLEFVSANPTGPLHIGHGRWAALGDTLYRLLSFTGHQVHKEFYINDAGNQIKLFRNSVEAIKNNTEVPEDGYQGDYVKALAKSNLDPVQSTIDEQSNVLESFGLKFDTWFSEKSLHDSGAIESALDMLTTSNYLYEKDGAKWFKTTQFGDDKDRVLVKADGAYTYFAVDIAYHWNKINRGFSKLIGILGADHHGYIQRLNAAVTAISTHENKNVTLQTLIGQLVNLFRGDIPVRMSKRTGDIITLSEVIDEIGVDASRYFLISQSANNRIDFDLELAKSKSQDNPVYYLQYAHARICRILEKSDILAESHLSRELEVQEQQLLLIVARFSDAIQEACQKMDPSKLTEYSSQVARAFHIFYNACPILNAEEVDPIRIKICEQVKNTIQTCCDLMGISAPEKM